MIESARRLADLVERSDGLSLDDLCHTAGVRRPHHRARAAVVARGRDELLAGLRALAGKREQASVQAGAAPAGGAAKVVFVFPGQGSQWIGMARQLLAEEPAFREALLACEVAVQRESGFSLLEQIEADEGRSRVAEIGVVQPLLFAVEVALAALWRAWGVEPDAVIGHSMGEVAAAHVAGILGLEDAVKVICHRSRLLRRVSGKGAMGLVELTLGEAEEALSGYEGRLGVAVSNGPRSTVLSGDPEALEEVLAALEKRGVFCRRVKVDVASHSPQVDPLQEDLRAALADVRPRKALIAMRSTVTGELLLGPELDAGYWVRNLRMPVLFSDVTQRLMKEGHGLFVEMSPHPILLPAVEENLREVKREGAAIASVRRNADERRSMLEALGALYVRGHAVDWGRVMPERGRCVSLPGYAWQRERFWLEQPEGARRGSRDLPRPARGITRCSGRRSRRRCTRTSTSGSSGSASRACPTWRTTACGGTSCSRAPGTSRWRSRRRWRCSARTASPWRTSCSSGCSRGARRTTSRSRSWRGPTTRRSRSRPATRPAARGRGTPWRRCAAPPTSPTRGGSRRSERWSGARGRWTGGPTTRRWRRGRSSTARRSRGWSGSGSGPTRRWAGCACPRRRGTPRPTAYTPPCWTPASRSRRRSSGAAPDETFVPVEIARVRVQRARRGRCG